MERAKQIVSVAGSAEMTDARRRMRRLRFGRISLCAMGDRSLNSSRVSIPDMTNVVEGFEFGFPSVYVTICKGISQ